MPRYIQKYIIADAWQMTGEAVDLPQWLVRKEFARVFSDSESNSDKTFSHGLLISEGDKTITVCTGDWVVLSNDGLVRMMDAEFQAKYQEIPALQGDLFDGSELPHIEFALVHHTGPQEADEPEAPEWFEFDSSKPANTMSVRDHVTLEFVKAKLSKVSKWTEIEEDEVESFVDWVLTIMGYD